jgi:hypothetical protein
VSNKSTLRFFVVLLCAAFSGAALVLAEAGALGQNTNSSTTEENAQDANTNANRSAPRRGRRGRGRRAPAAEPAADPSTGTQVAAPEAGPAGGAQADDSRGDLSGEQVDLSGTYEGNLSTAGGGGDIGKGKATLTITGNTFTLTTEGGATHNGRVYAVLTRGATSAALYFADIQDPATRTPVAYNVRARKSGDRLTLSPAPQTSARLTFAPGGGRGRRD